MAAPPIQFVVPGPLERRTGGTIYDRRIIEELRRHGDEVVVHALPGRFPLVDRAASAAAAAALASVPCGATVIVDGLAIPALVEHWTQRAAHADRLVALCHHPLAAETGLSEPDRSRLFDIERAGLDAAERIVVTSRHTGYALADYEVTPDRIRVVPPGLDRLPADGGRDTTLASPARLLCVANLIPRKGHDVLLDALERLNDIDWTLTCVGSTTMDPATAAAIVAASMRFAGRIQFAGLLSDEHLARAYRDADVFVLASRHEGYGMVFAEAMQYGLPIVGTTAGAIPEVVPPEAGVLVAPDDADAFAEALRRLLTENALYRRLSAGATGHANSLTTWAEAARLFKQALG